MVGCRLTIPSLEAWCYAWKLKWPNQACQRGEVGPWVTKSVNLNKPPSCTPWTRTYLVVSEIVIRFLVKTTSTPCCANTLMDMGLNAKPGISSTLNKCLLHQYPRLTLLMMSHPKSNLGVKLSNQLQWWLIAPLSTIQDLDWDVTRAIEWQSLSTRRIPSSVVETAIESE